MRLTVLGSAGTHPSAGRVCSGYLVQSGDTSLLLDAGNGSLANLQRLLALPALDAVVVSHRHVDHCVDLVGAFYALHLDPAFTDRLPLYAPAEVHETLAAWVSADSPLVLDDVYDHHLVGHGDGLVLGPLELSFARSIHPAPTVSTRVEVDGRSLVYSGDSAGGEDLIEIARGADLFLCEATWAGDPATLPPGVHLTARQAGEVARAADVGRLVLTHVAGGTDRDQVMTEASSAYDGPIDLAEDLAVHGPI